MTPEQERSIEALCLTGGGFASEVEARLVMTGRGGEYLVTADGDVMRIERRETTPFRRLMADTYGRGQTA